MVLLYLLSRRHSVNRTMQYTCTCTRTNKVKRFKGSVTVMFWYKMRDMENNSMDHCDPWVKAYIFFQYRHVLEFIVVSQIHVHAYTCILR